MSKATLILDKELEAANTPTDEKELQTRLKISAWHRRYWTLQEAALARNVYAIFGAHVYLVEDSPQAAIPRNALLLNNRSFGNALLLNTGSVLQIREHRLRQVWNALLGKTSTKRGELHAILASFLDISARTVLELPPRDRMKAIMGNYSRWPLDMVFSASPRTVEEFDQLSQTNDEDRWIPQFPGGFPLQIGREALYGSVEPDGFLIEGRLLNNSGVSRLKLFMQHGGSSHQGLFTLQDTQIWVETVQTQGYRPVRANGPAFYLLYARQQIGNETPIFRGNGARLILQHIDHDSYAEPRYHFIFDTPLVFGDLNSRNQELRVNGREVVVEELKHHLSIILSCDTTSWPKASFIRNSMRLPPLFVASVLTYCTILLLDALTPKHIRARWMHGRDIEFYSFIMATVSLVAAGEVARRFLHHLVWRSSFRPDYDPNQPWTLRLNEALEQHGSFAWRHCIIWVVAKVCIICLPPVYWVGSGFRSSWDAAFRLVRTRPLYERIRQNEELELAG
ncbi:hypothetical protein LTR27_001868 [Elasticomyces elasticus]|nr:hypothetical protein LTR27_001868 [Elasticomyces elasticus]